MMNIEKGISNYEPDVKTSSFRIRCSKFVILKAPVHLAPQDNDVSPLPSRRLSRNWSSRPSPPTADASRDPVRI